MIAANGISANPADSPFEDRFKSLHGQVFDAFDKCAAMDVFETGAGEFTSSFARIGALLGD